VFVAIPIGHAGTALTKTQYHLIAAFSSVRLQVEQARAKRGAAKPATDANDKIHDYNMVKSLLDSLADLTHSHLLGIIRNRKRVGDALPRVVSRNRAHSAATPTLTHATYQQRGTPTHIRYAQPASRRTPTSLDQCGRRIVRHSHTGKSYPVASTPNGCISHVGPDALYIALFIRVFFLSFFLSSYPLDISQNIPKKTRNKVQNTPSANRISFQYQLRHHNTSDQKYDT
jgi:hypothetical protein